MRLVRSWQYYARRLSYEYFHGNNGASIGAEHQKNWTGY